MAAIEDLRRFFVRDVAVVDEECVEQLVICDQSLLQCHADTFIEVVVLKDEALVRYLP